MTVLSKRISFFCALFFISTVLLLEVASASDCTQEQRLFAEASRLYKNHQMLLSAVDFSQLRFSSCDARLTSRAWLGYSLSVVGLNENLEAIEATENGLNDPQVRSEDKASLRMLRAWINQEPSVEFSQSQKNRWSLWQARMDRPSFQSELLKSDFAFSEREKINQLDLNLTGPQRKSPWLAGIASAVIPGAGQAYNGNWQASGLAFVLNALFLGATIELAKNRLPYSAVASGTVFSITYIGNILSAVQGSNDINRLDRAPSEAGLKSAILPELTF
jgi:hypothetical protein